MGHRRHKPQIFENVEITNLAAEGKAIAKIKDLVIFVTAVIPGDIVDLRTVKRKKNYREAVPIKFHKYSEKRIEAKCEHFGLCGGCKWQNLNYSDQLQYKQQQVVDALERIGKIELPEINPILPSEQEYYYRNKLEYTFSSKRWFTQDEIDTDDEIKDPHGLGFHIPGKFDKVLDIKKCHLQEEPSNKIRLAIKQFALEAGLGFYNIRTNEGFLRNIVIRSSTTGDLMVIVIFGYEDEAARTTLLDQLANSFPEITSLIYVINEKKNSDYSDQETICYKGKDHIFEQMDDLRFKIQAKSFYQTNSKQAYNLYKITKKYAKLTGDEVVYDLYTGTGTIANFVAREAKKVIGIEYIEDAIADAKINSEFNHITNTAFYAGDMKDILINAFIEQNDKPDVIIVDPPRAGMHPDVVKTILNANAQRIVYVSCNPATQARDIAVLDKKYTVKAIQPVDMFPQTHHVENVVLLELK